MKNAATLVCLAILLGSTSGCAQLRAFEQTLEEAGIARFDSLPGDSGTDGRGVTVQNDPLQPEQGRAAVIGPNQIITVNHVVTGEQAWVKTTRKGGWVAANVVRRIHAVPEDLVVLELVVDTGFFGSLLGFTGFAAHDQYVPAASEPTHVVTARGTLPWTRDVLRPGDSGSPVLDRLGRLVGLVSGRDRRTHEPRFTPILPPSAAPTTAPSAAPIVVASTPSTQRGA